MLGGTRRSAGSWARRLCLTITLLLNSEGRRWAKRSGAVMAGSEEQSPFGFYQYWRNVGDADVLKCLRMLTFLPLEQIDEMDHWEGSQLNQARILAFELTKLILWREKAGQKPRKECKDAVWRRQCG